MGRAARANARSTDGGKPKAYASFHRCIRACKTFGWLASTSATEAHCARMQKIWDELHPTPMVTLHASVPESLRA
jgi:hypothetical protein